ncbi:gluconate:H+ symporter [Arcticibacter eurypsychrophilus]|uniref:gluconate:H+ symporter n=1 Tax=Arcticibacter eurypsychrophilus TaxID=1434752 RepID=UPI00084DD550|nr:gluconate:H+ symporter [Arcticibacter eurypsychrophilus]
MALLYVLAGIIILLILILKKLNPMLALLIVSILTGLMLSMPPEKLMSSIGNGIGNTLGGMVMILSLGAMVGKLAEDSGAAKKIVFILINWFGIKNIQWAGLLTGLIVGIPLFFNAGFIVLIPLVFSIAAATGLPKLYVGMPMISALSITHGFLPPHPGPVALAAIFQADIGRILIYGLIISIPIAILSGVFLPRLIIPISHKFKTRQSVSIQVEEGLPSSLKSFAITLMPIFLIAGGHIGALFFHGQLQKIFTFLADPTVALLLSVILILFILNIEMKKAMESCVEGVKSVAMIILIIAAGGAFKQVLIDSGVGKEVELIASSWHASPLFLGWAIAALLRITLGSSTVAALTTSGMVMPFVHSGTSPELMVLSIGAGSLMFSHVNDTGFWMFKEYFGLSVKETFKTWTLMETSISFLGLLFVLLLNTLKLGL